MTAIRFTIRCMEQLADRVRAAREQRGWSQTELGRRAGVTGQAIQSIEAGRVKKPQNLTAIATALGLTSNYLLDGTQSNVNMVPVVGIAQAGTGVVDYSMGQGNLGEVEAPDDSSERTVALEVRGDSMGGRIEDGDTVFYDDRREPVTPDLYGRVCVIGLRSGNIVIKKLMAGSKPGHFHLLSYNSVPQFDVPVEWAAKVTSIRPR